jgi:hypothetical protein
MLPPNLDQKAVPQHGPRLLPRLIVRPHRGLMEGRPLLGYSRSRSSVADLRPGDPHPRDPRSVVTLQKREGLLEIRPGAPAPILPRAPLPEPVQPKGQGSGVRDEIPSASFGGTAHRGVCGLPHVLDTTLIPAVVRVRACRKGLFCGQATFGRCVSKTEWVYGFKVGLAITPAGVITAFALAEASADERPIGDFLIRHDGHDAYLADKGFSSLAWEQHWLREFGAVVAATPKDNSGRAWPQAARLWASGKCQIIEGVINQLKDQFFLERHRAKTLKGLLVRLASKITAYTCGQYSSTSNSVDRCVIWPICWSEQLCISRLSS